MGEERKGGDNGVEWGVGDCWWDTGSKWRIQAFLRMHTDKRYFFPLLKPEEL